jgi:hypothetical protein
MIDFACNSIRKIYLNLNLNKLFTINVTAPLGEGVADVIQEATCEVSKKYKEIIGNLLGELIALEIKLYKCKIEKQ